MKKSKKDHSFTIRITENELQNLNFLANHFSIKRPEIIRKMIKLMEFQKNLFTKKEKKCLTKKKL